MMSKDQAIEAKWLFLSLTVEFFQLISFSFSDRLNGNSNFFSNLTSTNRGLTSLFRFESWLATLSPPSFSVVLKIGYIVIFLCVVNFIYVGFSFLSNNFFWIWPLRLLRMCLLLFLLLLSQCHASFFFVSFFRGTARLSGLLLVYSLVLPAVLCLVSLRCCI